MYVYYNCDRLNGTKTTVIMTGVMINNGNLVAESRLGLLQKSKKYSVNKLEVFTLY